MENKKTVVTTKKEVVNTTKVSKTMDEHFNDNISSIKVKRNYNSIIIIILLVLLITISGLFIFRIVDENDKVSKNKTTTTKELIMTKGTTTTTRELIPPTTTTTREIRTVMR